MGVKKLKSGKDIVLENYGKKHNIFLEYKLSKRIRLQNTSIVEEGMEFINLIHPNNTGYFAFFTKQSDGAHQYMVKDIDFNTLQNFMSLKDLYVGINSFYIPKRKGKYIRQMNAFWVDLDYYKKEEYKDKTAEEMLEIMSEDGMFKNLEPSLVIDSGQGMYLIFLIEDTPKQWATSWRKIERQLVTNFESYGADLSAMDLPRVLRITGTINTKTGRRARTVKTNFIFKRYGIKEIKEIILTETPKKELPYTTEEWKELQKQRKKKRKKYKQSMKDNKSIKLRTIKNLNYTRLMDIKKLIKLRNGEMEGYRNNALFMYALFYAYCNMETRELKHQLERINNTFSDPLDTQDLEVIIKSVKKEYKVYLDAIDKYNKKTDGNYTVFLRKNGCIIYSNNTIIKKLGITSAEMHDMDTVIAHEVKLQRKRDKYYEKKEKNGKSTRKVQTQELKEKIRQYKREGINNKNIATSLNICVRTVERYVTKLEIEKSGAAEIKSDRKVSNNKNKSTSRKQQKQDLMNKVNKLKEKGLNNTEIAKKLGISRGYVSNIVNNKV